MKTDLKLVREVGTNIYDIDFDSDGDFLMIEGLDTSILMSVFGEKRATASELIEPIFRRGDWSNELNDVIDYQVGSLYWLLEQARADQESLNLAIDALEDGLSWMIDDALVKEVSVDGDIIDNEMILRIELTQKNDQIDTYRFNAFSATGIR